MTAAQMPQMTLPELRDFLKMKISVLEAEIEGEAPSRLRVDCTSEDAADECAAVIQLVSSYRPVTNGATVTVDDGDDSQACMFE